MSLFDSIKGALGGVVGQDGIPGLLSNALAQAGGLQGILAKLEAGGLGEQVKSWIGTGANLPVSAEQIQAALGNQQVQQIAAAVGIPTDTVLAFLSEHLPKAVDQATPDGTLPPTAAA
ncbi:YidB family protein [Inquilinus sp. Marseille-Q2685]|uniref:YidB family protein n=1 Tax=Inquilinus sp. Marseille-Q2685 TaxID=2866581 RepID=UPI001CE47EA1|nr:YidB family protein [Inquilinus sp. Marseille-Q2685]